MGCGGETTTGPGGGEPDMITFEVTGEDDPDAGVEGDAVEEDSGEDAGGDPVEDAVVEEDTDQDAIEGDAGGEDTSEGDTGSVPRGIPSIGQTAGGAALSSENYLLNITVGVPNPMGGRSGENYRIRVGLPVPSP
jgi:hypothetical protein